MGYEQPWKIKQHGLLSITNPVLSYFLYIFAHYFTSKFGQIKKEDKEIKKNNILIRKMYNPGFELKAPGFGGRRSNHFAMKDS